MSARIRQFVTLCIMIATCFAIGLIPSRRADARSIAPPPPLTMSYGNAEVAVVAGWVSAEPGKSEREGKTTYKTLRILKDATRKLKVGVEFVRPGFYPRNVDQQFLVLGNTHADGTAAWGIFEESTPALLEYLLGFPAQKAEREQLSYLLPFLEHPEESIGDDAFRQISEAAGSDLIPLANEFPRKKLRKWVADPATNKGRLDLYGVMLGLCGRREDALLLERKLLEPVIDDGFQLGNQGLMTGYLLLTREQGSRNWQSGNSKTRNRASTKFMPCSWACGIAGDTRPARSHRNG